jgi:hypothetical protein
MTPMNATRFSQLVENKIAEWTDEQQSYMQAIIAVCDKYSIDPDNVKKFLTAALLTKLQAEAVRLKLVS